MVKSIRSTILEKTQAYGRKGGLTTRSPDKGHLNCLKEFVNCSRKGGEWPIPFEEIIEVSRHAIQLSDRA